MDHLAEDPNYYKKLARIERHDQNPVPATAREREKRLRQIRRERGQLERILALEQRRSLAPYGAALAVSAHDRNIRYAEERLTLLRSEERALAAQPFRRQANPLILALTTYMLAQEQE